MSTNAISYEDYKKLLAAGQKYVAQQQAADPEWASFLQRAAATSVENAGELGASPTTDYWAKYMTTLSPQQALGFQQNMADSKSWTDQVGSVLKYAIPAAVGGAGLAATGLLGTGLQAAVGGAPLGSVGGAAAAAPAASAGLMGEAASASLPLWDTGVGGLFGSQAAIDSAMTSAGWFPGASMAAGTGAAGGLMLGDLLPAAYQSVLGSAGGGTLLDKIINKAPELLKQGGNLLGGASGGGGFGGASLGLGGGGAPGPGYKAPTMPAMPQFKAASGLADLVRNMGPRQVRPLRPLGLLGE